MCGILVDMPCGGDDPAVFDVEDVFHGRTSRHACRLRTPVPATPPISASTLASTHANRRLFDLGWRELTTVSGQPRALLWTGLPTSMNRGRRKTRINAFAWAG